MPNRHMLNHRIPEKTIDDKNTVQGHSWTGVSLYNGIGPSPPRE